MSNTFMYFAYGSNLLKKRIHINNPSAEFIGIGRLNDHQLDFVNYSDNWRGSSATIVPTPDTHLWGAVWKLNKEDLPSLDKQEGVDTNLYFPKIVTVETPNMNLIECRTYQQTKNPPTRAINEDIPHERRPSITYINCILKGARECQLPDYYIQKLCKITHNGMEACPKLIENIEEHLYTKYIVKLSHVLEDHNFNYFAYGSNLLETKMIMDNPSAIFLTIGRLDNYRIDFLKYSKFWNGPTITAVPTANAHIWGAIWKLHKDDMISLDNQKGVDMKLYYPKNVNIITPHMGAFKCRIYIQRVNASPRGDHDVIPYNQWPSKTYLDVIVRGAVERGLPDYYVRVLKEMKHNKEEGFLEAEELLRRYAARPPCQCERPGRVHRGKLKLDLNKLRDKNKTTKHY